jgi:hypothetical protein
VHEQDLVKVDVELEEALPDKLLSEPQAVMKRARVIKNK